MTAASGADPCCSVCREIGGPHGVPASGADQPTPQCPLSQRVDGKLHSWRFDGDDPYVTCVYCDQLQDSLTGRVIRVGRSR